MINAGRRSNPLLTGIANSLAPVGAFAQPFASLIGRVVFTSTNSGLETPAFSPSCSFMIIFFKTFCFKDMSKPFCFPSSSSSISRSEITQPAPDSSASFSATCVSVIAVEASIHWPHSAVPTAMLILEGCVPSTTCRFGLSEVGGQEEPGQCHTNVLRPSSANTFHRGSALQLVESKEYTSVSKSVGCGFQKSVIPCVPA